jgi:predicted Zn-dependent protease
MPDSNPAKIHFRIQIVNAKWFHDAWTLPSGIILISHQVVERMANDDQLATVLADSIACALERQDYRVKPLDHAATAALVGADVADVFVPFVGPAVQVATIGGAVEALRRRQEQSGRVSLGLLRDAGYNIEQAPLAWWRLASLKNEPVTSLAMPDRAAYLYKTLGEYWSGGTRPTSTKP